MLCDIQGSNNTSYDPEIATMQGPFDAENKLLICMGNLSTVVKDNFIKGHKCTNFCEMAKLVDNENLGKTNE